MKNLLFKIYYFQVDNIHRDTPEIWTEVVEKASWDLANKG